MATLPPPIRDVVIVVPGIMGSALVDRDGTAVWSVSPGALVQGIRTLGRSIQRIALPDGIGDEAPDDGIRPTALVNSLHVIPGLWTPVTGYDGLMRHLASDRFDHQTPSPDDPGRAANLLTFPYDWRLSNRYNGRRLATFAGDALQRWHDATGDQRAKLVLVCHSMGGLIARWFAEREGGAPLIRSIITIGTPYRGSVKALDALFELEAGLGPLRLSLTQFARSLPAIYQLLPQYKCIVTADGRVDLATAQLAQVDATMLADANAFHDALAGATSNDYRLFKIVGIRQPTPTTAYFDGDRLVTLNDLDGRDQQGDGTVPRHAADLLTELEREVQEVADQHGSLQAASAAQQRIEGTIARTNLVYQGAEPDGFGVEMADVWSSRDEPVVTAQGAGDRRVLVEVQDERGKTVVTRRPLARDGTCALGRLGEGGYRAIVQTGAPRPHRVVKPFVVIDPETP